MSGGRWRVGASLELFEVTVAQNSWAFLQRFWRRGVGRGASCTGVPVDSATSLGFGERFEPRCLTPSSLKL